MGDEKNNDKVGREMIIYLLDIISRLLILIKNKFTINLQEQCSYIKELEQILEKLKFNPYFTSDEIDLIITMINKLKTYITNLENKQRELLTTDKSKRKDEDRGR